MALTKAESAALMQDLEFRGRIKVSILQFATSILDEQPNVPGHPTRYRWAQNVGNIPDQEAARAQPMVVMDSAVQESGADITDAALQAAVEAVVNKFIL